MGGRRIGLVFAVSGLLLGLLSGCGVGVETAEHSVEALPEVVSADFDFDGGGLIDDLPTLDASVVVTSQASVDQVADIAARTLRRIDAVGVPGLYGYLQITTADLPDDPLTVKLSPPLDADLLAAETRHWLLLREQLPGARMRLRALEQGGRWERIIDVATPGTDLRGELPAAFATFERVAGEQATYSTLTVAVADPDGTSHPPILFSSTLDVPPPEVLATMVALAELAPTNPKFGNGVVVQWYDGQNNERPFLQRPYLDVQLAIGLDEFYYTPGNQINDRIAGSETERLAQANLAVLDAAGIPYRLRASVFTNDFFLEVDRR